MVKSLKGYRTGLAALPPFLRRVLAFLLAMLTAVFLSMFLLIVLLHDREVTLPAWAETEVSNRIEASLSGLSFNFESAFLTLDNTWRPSLGFKDIEITQSKNSNPILLNQMTVKLSLARALQGKLWVNAIQVDGVVVSLLRDQSGSVTAQFSGLENQLVPSLSAPDIIAAIDTYLGQQALSSFQSLDARGITLEYIDQWSDRRWTVDGARFNIQKTQDKLIARADLALLTGGAGVATLEASFEHVIGESESHFGVKFEDMPAEVISSQIPVLAWLNSLRAPLSGALRSGIDSSGSLELLHGTLQISNGAIQPNPESRAILFEAASTYFTYDATQALLSFDDITISSRDLNISAEGYLILEPSNDWPNSLSGQLKFGEILVNPRGQLKLPVSLQDGIVDVRLLLDPFELQVKQFFASDKDRDLVVNGSAKLRAAEQGWSVDLDVAVPRLLSNQILAYWPSNFKPKTRKWVQNNVKLAELENVHYALRLVGDQPARADLGFDYSRAEIKVLKDLPPLQRASGQFSLSNSRLATQLTSAIFTPKIGESLDFSGSQFIIPDTRIKPAPAVAKIKAKGDVSSALNTLNYPPMKVVERTEFLPDTVDGQAVIDAKVEFPVMRGAPPDQIKYEAFAVIRDAESKKLIPNQDISAEEVKVYASNNALQIDTVAEIKGIPFKSAFRMPMGKNRDGSPAVLRSRVLISQDLIDAFSLPIPQGFLNGESAAELNVELSNGASSMFYVSSDLIGSELSLDRFNWRKPKARQMQFDLVGRLGEPIELDQISLSGAGLTMEAQLNLNTDNQFESLEFSKFSIADMMDVSGALMANGDLDLTNGSLDLTKLLATDSTAPQKTRSQTKLDVKLDKVKISKNNTLHQVQGQFVQGATLSGEFMANLNGRAPFVGQVSPNDGKMKIAAGSNDAGQFLMGLNVLERAQGGRLVLNLNQRDIVGEMDGVLKITDIKLQRMPILAELLNAISIVGLLDQLSGPGVLMNEIDATFRLTNDQIIVSSASALGPSMGITLDGYYGLESGRFDMQGVFSPLYLVNGIGSILTRKGEGFIGFSFKLQGTADRPRFIINPLSAITPSLFRDLFRRPPPKLD